MFTTKNINVAKIIVKSITILNLSTYANVFTNY